MEVSSQENEMGVFVQFDESGSILLVNPEGIKTPVHVSEGFKIEREMKWVDAAVRFRWWPRTTKRGALCLVSETASPFGRSLGEACNLLHRISCACDNSPLHSKVNMG
jgi:hypothetical protein